MARFHRPVGQLAPVLGRPAPLPSWTSRDQMVAEIGRRMARLPAGSTELDILSGEIAGLAVPTAEIGGSRDPETSGRFRAGYYAGSLYRS
jgi:hypothetical protein